MKKDRQKFVYVLAVFLLLGGAGVLIFSGLSQNSVYFLNVAEATALPDRYARQMRLFGEVAEHDLQGESARLGVNFSLLDKDSKTSHSKSVVQVVYTGAVPDTFKTGIEVILEGKFDRETDVFFATSLMTKCPSKYEPDEEGRLRPPGYNS